ncbi:hydrolase 1, exosortase A system-associated [Sphingobium boeckii]|uniref:Exosortase A-associated hydrolase 1 n=1 Tax=Sphingobium boeckii TaxID=1082345 RepID=A0A7W9AKK6_9SPHN|nr:hydrolase 1, exosortase A system-associated [Sphingobium boeckii]MBB5687404.1 exosortase A-associated hydrolase 1 [Sphingobium boeckii]
MRRWLTFRCSGEMLAATLDDAPGSAGLLIVSGGNEARSGAHGGMAQLAAAIATAGHPVFRYDRRGVGDSSGVNGGFETAGADIAAAIAAFREAAPQLHTLVAFGNCDAATALALLEDRSRLAALVLANPWVIETPSDLPPPAAIRARYAQKLRDPREWLRLLGGDVNFRKLIKGLGRISAPSSESDLAERLRAGLTGYAGRIAIILARRDATALAFQREWNQPGFAALRSRCELTLIESASHSFAHPADQALLQTRLLCSLANGAA